MTTENSEQPEDLAVTEQMKEAQEIVQEHGRTFGDLVYTKTGRAIAAAAAISSLSTVAVMDPEGGAPIRTSIEATYNGVQRSVNDTVKRFEAQHSRNESLSPAMENGFHVFFPDLNLSEITLVTKVRSDGGYAYDFTRNESGESTNPIWATGIDGIPHELTRAFEYDDGSINFDDGQGEVLKFNGFTGSLHSVPATRAQQGEAPTGE
jgi:hypothetical protein